MRFHLYSFQSFVKKVAPADPWDGRTLEWSTSSPPPVHDFDEVPQVVYRDDFWFKKHPETIIEYYEHGDDQIADSSPQDGNDDHGGHEDEHGHGGIHLPDMSYYPFILAGGITMFGIGFLTHWGVIIAGTPFFIWGTLGWCMEPVNDPE